MLKYLSEAKAAKYLGISNFAMQNLRNRQMGPPFTRLSPTLIRYSIDDLNAFLLAKRVEHPKKVVKSVDGKESSSTQQSKDYRKSKL